MTNLETQLKKEDFNYDLPEECVAHYPLKDRSKSKLLVYKNSNDIEDSRVSKLYKEFPNGALFIINDTRVLPFALIW